MAELSKKLGELLGKSAKTSQLIESFVNYDENTAIRGITNSSKEINKDFIFVAVKGENFDGHDFAEEAVANGASVIVVERRLELNVCQLVVHRGLIRVALAEFAASFYGHPFDRLKTIGITGTNGKTSVSAMVKAMLEYNGTNTEIVGTLNSTRTTPEAHNLNKIAYEALEKGKSALVMEVSSIGLSLGRVEGLHFDIAAFTNISHDHLDFHKTMEDYYLAKKALFYNCDTAVIFRKDEWSQRLIDELSDQSDIAIKTVSHSDATNIVPNLCGTDFSVNNQRISLDWGGIFTVDNALLAFSIGMSLSIPPDKIAEGISSCPKVKGRFELVAAPTLNTAMAVVDYAHTPDALKAALVSAKIVAKNRVAVVFGCGGDRDAMKRSEMGKVATELADIVIITNDNPRTEDPAEIVRQITSGLDENRYMVIQDRSKAIETAIEITDTNDVVLIAGKGHETYQIFKENIVDFSDFDVALDKVNSKIQRKNGQSAPLKTGETNL